MNNRQLADTFTLIADLLEIKGEIIYKTLAYRKAAESLTSLGRDANEYWKEGKLKEIPGVGKAIADKIDELLQTGELGFLQKLEAEVPPGLADWLQVPGLGPKKDRPDLEGTGHHQTARVGKGRQRRQAARPARHGREIRSADHCRDRIAGAAFGPHPFGTGLAAGAGDHRETQRLEGVVAAEPAGSLRRMRPTVGDLDILVAANNSAPVMEAFTSLPGVMRVLGKGETKSSIEFTDGVRAQLWVLRLKSSARRWCMPPAPKTTTCACANWRSTRDCRSPSMP